MPDTKCQIECQNICQIEGQKDQKEFQIECQNIRQIDCHRMSVGGDRYVRSNSLLSHKHGTYGTSTKSTIFRIQNIYQPIMFQSCTLW